MINVQITDEWYLTAHNFAEQCAPTNISHYKKRGQGTLSKIEKDIHTGKLVELAAYVVLQKLGLNPTFPDFEIYKGRKKSFDADMRAGKYRFHCKGQAADSQQKYGASWILQWGGRGRGHVDKLFKQQTEEDFLIPGYVMEDRRVKICGIYQICDIMENGLIAKPAVEWLANTKRAIYKEDLDQHYGDERRWGPFQKLYKEAYENND